jgi:pilus assembly protein Flp/PilA
LLILELSVIIQISIKKGGGLMRNRLSEKGQGLLEYALILVLVALIVIVVLALLGPQIGYVFSNIVLNL